MKKLLLTLITPYFLFAGYHANISKISPAVKKHMIEGGSWHRGCPVPLSDLRYLTMTYKGFDGRDHHNGEMIVHRSVAREVTEIFGKLYASKYPIKRMRLVSDYHASDFQSIEADNTSAFNCRRATGSRGWSKHSFGKAIDINPIENPYIRHNGKISHKASYIYKIRIHKNITRASDKAMLIQGDKAVEIFTKKGWRWGATFKEARDLQHFHKL